MAVRVVSRMGWWDVMLQHPAAEGEEGPVDWERRSCAALNTRSPAWWRSSWRVDDVSVDIVQTNCWISDSVYLARQDGTSGIWLIPREAHTQPQPLAHTHAHTHAQRAARTHACGGCRGEDRDLETYGAGPEAGFMHPGGPGR